MDRLIGSFILALGIVVSLEPTNGNTADSSQSVSCMDAVTCTPDSTALTDAITSSRHEEACNILKTSHNCLKSAIADCKANNLISGEGLKSIEDSYKVYEQQMTQYCQSTTGDTSCFEATACIPDTDRLTDAVTNSRFQEACQILTSSTNCLQSAVEDCKARGMMSETEIQSMEQLQASYQPQIQQMCQSTATDTGGVGCFQMQTCMPNDATARRLNESIANQQFEEACKIMKPAIKCQLSAVEDCRTRGVLDSSSMEEMEKGLAFAQGEMKKYCNSGNSASTSMFHILLATLGVIAVNFMKP